MSLPAKIISYQIFTNSNPLQHYQIFTNLNSTIKLAYKKLLKSRLNQNSSNENYITSFIPNIKKTVLATNALFTSSNNNLLRKKGLILLEPNGHHQQYRFMSCKLDGKNIVIFGGFGGIGVATCKSLLRKNIGNLIILDLHGNRSALDKLQSEFPDTQIIYQQADITNKRNIENNLKKIIKIHKNIDIVINGCGVVGEKNAEATINVNLTGLINTCLAAIPIMDRSLRGKGGLLVNIASTLGLVPCPPFSVYSASKHGVIGFTRSLADEYYYKKTGIGVMAICPVLTDTRLVEDNKPAGGTFSYSKEVMKKFMIGKKQSVEQCAENIIKAIESNKNGSIWILEFGKMKEVKFPTLWEPNYTS